MLHVIGVWQPSAVIRRISSQSRDHAKITYLSNMTYGTQIIPWLVHALNGTNALSNFDKIWNPWDPFKDMIIKLLHYSTHNSVFMYRFSINQHIFVHTTLPQSHFSVKDHLSVVLIRHYTKHIVSMNEIQLHVIVSDMVVSLYSVKMFAFYSLTEISAIQSHFNKDQRKYFYRTSSSNIRTSSPQMLMVLSTTGWTPAYHSRNTPTGL